MSIIIDFLIGLFMRIMSGLTILLNNVLFDLVGLNPAANADVYKDFASYGEEYMLGSEMMNNFLSLFPIFRSLYDVLFLIAHLMVFFFVINGILKNFLPPSSSRTVEHPAIVIGRGIGALFLVQFATFISGVFLHIATVLFVEFARGDNRGNVHEFVDNLMGMKSFEGFGGREAGGLAATALTAVDAPAMAIILVSVLFILISAYFKLILEIIERYIVMCLLAVFGPIFLAFIGSGNTMGYTKRWAQAMITQAVLMGFSTLWLNAIVSAMGAGEGATIALSGFGMLLLLTSFINVGKDIDKHMQTLGLTTLQGGNFGNDVFAAVATGSRMMSGIPAIKNNRGKGASELMKSGNMGTKARLMNNPNAAGPKGATVSSADAKQAAKVMNNESKNSRRTLGSSAQEINKAVGADELNNQNGVVIDSVDGQMSELIKNKQGGEDLGLMVNSNSKHNKAGSIPLEEGKSAVAGSGQFVEAVTGNQMADNQQELLANVTNEDIEASAGNLGSTAINSGAFTSSGELVGNSENLDGNSAVFSVNEDGQIVSGAVHLGDNSFDENGNLMTFNENESGGFDVATGGTGTHFMGADGNMYGFNEQLGMDEAGVTGYFGQVADGGNVVLDDGSIGGLTQGVVVGGEDGTVMTSSFENGVESVGFSEASAAISDGNLETSDYQMSMGGPGSNDLVFNTSTPDQTIGQMSESMQFNPEHNYVQLEDGLFEQIDGAKSVRGLDNMPTNGESGKFMADRIDKETGKFDRDETVSLRNVNNPDDIRTISANDYMDMKSYNSAGNQSREGTLSSGMSVQTYNGTYTLTSDSLSSGSFNSDDAGRVRMRDAYSGEDKYVAYDELKTGRVGYSELYNNGHSVNYNGKTSMSTYSYEADIPSNYAGSDINHLRQSNNGSITVITPSELSDVNGLVQSDSRVNLANTGKNGRGGEGSQAAMRVFQGTYKTPARPASSNDNYHVYDTSSAKSLAHELRTADNDHAIKGNVTGAIVGNNISSAGISYFESRNSYGDYNYSMVVDMESREFPQGEMNQMIERGEATLTTNSRGNTQVIIPTTFEEYSKAKSNSSDNAALKRFGNKITSYLAATTRYKKVNDNINIRRRRGRL